LNVGEVTASTSNSWGVGGICGNIGEDNHTYNFSPVFENCVNGGAINCKSNSNAVSAAGILSRNNYTTTIIKNCINLGTLTHASYPSNIVPITAKYGSVTYNVSGCSYLSGNGNPVFGETAKSLSDIRTDVATALTVGLKSESEYYNYRNSDTDINSVGEGVDKILSATTFADIKQGCLAIYDHVTSLVLISDKKTELVSELGVALSNNDGKYTAESYIAYTEAYEKIKTDINAATITSEIDAIDVLARKTDAESLLVLTQELLEAKKTELLALLGDKIYNDEGKYTLDSYEAYSNAYLAIKSIIDNATDLSVLNVLDVATLKSAAEAKLVLNITPSPEPPESDEELEAKKTELLTLLGEKIYNDEGKYTLDSYEAYSNAYLAIKSIIDNATDLSVLNVLDIATLKSAAEAKLVLDDVSSDGDSVMETEKETETEIETETETEAISVAKRKCGASLAFSAVVVVSAIGVAFTIKKKD
jgi:hypothetical protein